MRFTSPRDLALGLSLTLGQSADASSSGLDLGLSLALGSSNGAAPSCRSFTVPVSVQAVSYQPYFPPFSTHYESVSLLNGATSRGAGPPSSALNPSPNPVCVEVSIAATFCAPKTASKNAIQILSHGIGFDSTYWNFGGLSSNYSYVKAATDAGYYTLAYDRIGNGNSSKPNPYNITQVQVEVEILKFLTDAVRNVSQAHPPTRSAKIIHVGHSYGSFVSNGLVAKYPTSSDGLVLTGYSGNLAYESAFAVSSNFHLARENVPARFGTLDPGYLTWGDELSNQYSFFAYPYFSTDVLAKAEKTKWPFGIGALLTANSTVASSYTGPVLVLSGQQDRIFCGSDCSGGFLDSSKQYFPSAAPFVTYVQPDTGHALNLHYNSSAAYAVATQFLAANGL